DVVREYAAGPQKTWSQHAAELALRARASVRVEDKAVWFTPLGAVSHTVREDNGSLSPDGLTFHSTPPPANDVTMLGAGAPGAYVKDYFFLDTVTRTLTPSHTPFSSPVRVLLEETYLDAELSPARWALTDPGAVIAIASSQLRVNGGTGSLGA